MKVTTRNARVRFSVFAKPRASKSRITGERGEDLEVALAAPPVDGAANEELVATLARALGVPKRQVELVGGEKGRSKIVEVDGLSEQEVLSRLQAHLAK